MGTLPPTTPTLATLFATFVHQPALYKLFQRLTSTCSRTETPHAGRQNLFADKNRGMGACVGAARWPPPSPRPGSRLERRRDPPAGPCLAARPSPDPQPDPQAGASEMRRREEGERDGTATAEELHPAAGPLGRGPGERGGPPAPRSVWGPGRGGNGAGPARPYLPPRRRRRRPPDPPGAGAGRPRACAAHAPYRRRPREAAGRGRAGPRPAPAPPRALLRRGGRARPGGRCRAGALPAPRAVRASARRAPPGPLCALLPLPSLRSPTVPSCPLAALLAVPSGRPSVTSFPPSATPRSPHQLAAADPLPDRGVPSRV